jgi:hypothetical protein
VLLLALAFALGGSPLPPDVKPWPMGVGPGFQLRAAPESVLAGYQIGTLRCEKGRKSRFGVHLELFIRRQVLLVPAGIGVAKPFRLRFARVLPGRCTYPLRTLDPTGVIEVRPGSSTTLGHFFGVWGQPLGHRQIAGFRTRAPLLAFVGGKRWRGDPRAIPLTRHAQIVLELGGYVPPHPRYLFVNGL